MSNMSLNVSRRGGFENFSFTDNFQSIIVPLFTTIKTCALLNLSCDDIIINRMTLYQVLIARYLYNYGTIPQHQWNHEKTRES